MYDLRLNNNIKNEFKPTVLSSKECADVNSKKLIAKGDSQCGRQDHVKLCLILQIELKP